MDKNYNEIRLKNGVRRAIYEALADLEIARLECKIEQYRGGLLTAKELLDDITDAEKRLNGATSK